MADLIRDFLRFVVQFWSRLTWIAICALIASAALPRLLPGLDVHNLLIVCTAAAVAAALFARERGHGSFFWAALCAAMPPLVLAVMVFMPYTVSAARRGKYCPHCDSVISKVASKCPACQTWLKR